ncbi:olfactory receptor 13A1-like protein, partial [Cricetulus griseus]
LICEHKDFMPSATIKQQEKTVLMKVFLKASDLYTRKTEVQRDTKDLVLAEKETVLSSVHLYGSHLSLQFTMTRKGRVYQASDDPCNCSVLTSKCSQ